MKITTEALNQIKKTLNETYQKEQKQKEIIKSVLSEDVDQLDELSKGTLGSYIKRAKDDLENKSYYHGLNHGRGSYNNAYGVEKGAEVSIKKTNKLKDRSKNIDKAVNKLTKEDIDEQTNFELELLESLAEKYGLLDELSKGTLGSYIKKAINSKDENEKEMEGTKKLRNDLDRADIGRNYGFKNPADIRTSKKFGIDVADQANQHNEIKNKMSSILRNKEYAHSDIINKRKDGIRRAINKLSK